jgi:hypothetical protein
MPYSSNHHRISVLALRFTPGGTLAVDPRVTQAVSRVNALSRQRRNGKLEARTIARTGSEQVRSVVNPARA